MGVLKAALDSKCVSAQALVVLRYATRGRLST